MSLPFMLGSLAFLFCLLGLGYTKILQNTTEAWTTFVINVLILCIVQVPTLPVLFFPIAISGVRSESSSDAAIAPSFARHTRRWAMAEYACPAQQREAVGM